MGGIVSLINFIGWEVCRINVGSEFRLEWCTNGAEFVKINPTEKLMRLDLVGINSSKAMLGITNKANAESVQHNRNLD
jgi:hypothetical protein